MNTTKNKINRPTTTQSDFLPIISGVQRLPEFIRFATWYATPRQFRKPKTQKEFAEVIEVCADTLTDWKRHPEFQKLAYQTMDGWIKDRVPDAIGALYKKVVQKGHSKDVETFLRLSGLMELMKINKPKNKRNC